MENTNILDQTVDSDELYHYGIRGMKWGVRRYQNKDGSLTPAGEKRRAKLEGKLEKLGGKKKVVSDEDTVQPTKKSSTSDMSDKELQDKVNRLRNEDAYNELNKKLGYDGPKTELDAKIADMEKQKRYLELQRDIKNLTPQKVSLGKKVLNSVVNEVIAPAAKAAGKKYVEQYLSNAAANVLKDTAKKQGSKVADSVKDAAEKAAKKESKKQERQQAKAKKKARSSSDSDSIKFTVEDIPSNYKPSSTATNTGRNYVSGYLTTPVAGLLPAPKDER